MLTLTTVLLLALNGATAAPAAAAPTPVLIADIDPTFNSVPTHAVFAVATLAPPITPAPQTTPVTQNTPVAGNTPVPQSTPVGGVAVAAAPSPALTPLAQARVRARKHRARNQAQRHGVLSAPAATPTPNVTLP